MTEPERILITGFMCAGKTTVAEALARRLNCSMLDLDRLIAERMGRSIKAIIDEEGEARFRAVEERELRYALEKTAARVIALGGGAWANARNRALIARHKGFTVWLDAPFELCWQRITGAGDTRPLARHREQARRLYEARRAIYELAPLRVRVGEEDSADKVAEEIARALGQRSIEGG
ncbi:MAG TPA: shikimate kinase [Pyrinomonadaceae bacterium]|jgi:shikimate kinase|nr:shikimate kinase [Pyrinomonadaceae bacterium]